MLTVQDLIHPVGEIQPQMFPDGDVQAACAVWLDDAVVKTAHMDAGERQDQAQKCWVYYRAASMMASRIASTPTEQRSYETRTSWSIKYAEFWKKLADEYLGEFNRIASLPNINARTAQSRSVRTQVNW